MNELVLDFKEVVSEDTANIMVDNFVSLALDQKGLKLQFANDFFTKCLGILQKPSNTPANKFYTVFMLKQLSLRQQITRKLFGPLSKHPLYEFIENLALTTDPKKAIQEKGKTMFSGDKSTGNSLIRLILQSLMVWGSRFGSRKDKPTRFTTTMQRINQAKLVTPKNFIYYSKKGQKEDTPGGQESKVTSKVESGIPQAKPKGNKEKYNSQIRYMFNKVQDLRDILDEAEDPQEISTQVYNHHQKFMVDLERLQSVPQMIEGQDQTTMGLYFSLVDFYNEQKGLFQSYASKDDYGSYITGFKITYEKCFGASTLRNPQPKQEPSIAANIPSKLTQSKTSKLPTKPQIRNESAKVEIEPEINVKKVQSKYDSRQSRLNSNAEVMGSFFSKLRQNSRSPNVFSSVAKSLSRQKQSGIVAKKRVPNPLAISNFNRSRFGGSSMAKSVAPKGIFAAPPNPKLKPRNYEGQLVAGSGESLSLSESILKFQGHRRFKACHFKKKYILYEDDSIQLGFKADQIYQKVDKFSAMLLFELYFGNKKDTSLQRMTITFRGDHQSLIYTSPQFIEQNIPPLQQNKLELLNIPKSIPFSHITMQMNYICDGQTRHVSVYLPNSILQMTSYFPIEKSNFSSIWADCTKIIKTAPFRLSHYFPPDQLTQVLPSLHQNSSYRDFVREGSTTDYELFTQLFIQQMFQGVLKIIVRPDLTTVLQVGLYENEQNCVSNFRFYLQSLELVLGSQL